jgi:histidinol dehydrogenase
MCFGTASIPRVDKVVGPGNAYVAEAKLQLASAASFDSPAGPSELLIIADDNANSIVVAREVLAQAEHDPDATVLTLVTSNAKATSITNEIQRQVSTAPRAEIISRSLADRGGVLVVTSIDDAVSLSNAFAPEHLLLAVSDPRKALENTRNAGTVFLGESSSVAFGDYMTGGNHVLPTGGLARSYSGLSTLDFVRWTTYQEVTPFAAAGLSADVAVFAKAEGLFAHAAASDGWKGTKS